MADAIWHPISWPKIVLADFSTLVRYDQLPSFWLRSITSVTAASPVPPPDPSPPMDTFCLVLRIKFEIALSSGLPDSKRLTPSQTSYSPGIKCEKANCPRASTKACCGYPDSDWGRRLRLT